MNDRGRARSKGRTSRRRHERSKSEGLESCEAEEKFGITNARFASKRSEVALRDSRIMFAPRNITWPVSTISEVCHGTRHWLGPTRSGHACGARFEFALSGAASGGGSP